ncbi:polar amino acid transport system substrate-binding protein [Paraburkholderia sp. GAS333]|uniref:ABC transporter substrate-binding protein n=1 Tax=Paraburkholderia sp. GAS333 TaxID=3156279 RepID=UPI003D24FBB1
MTSGNIRKSLVLSAIAVVVFGLGSTAFAANTLDLTPEQRIHIRADQDKDAIKSLPTSFRFVQNDSLTVGIAVALPPLSTYATDEKTVVGFDPDLAQLVADSIGKKLKLVPVAWADWPLALASGKVDAVISNVTVTEERKEKFDFSTYRRDQLGFYTKVDSKITSIKEPKDVAGLRIITDAGTNQEKILLEWDKENVAHGLKPLSIQYYDDEAVREVALQAGRADAIFSVNAMLAYVAARQGKLHQVGTVSGGWPRTAEVAITTRRGSGLADPLTTSLNDLIADGKYHQILDKWNLDSEAINKAATNPPGLPKL